MDFFPCKKKKKKRVNRIKEENRVNEYTKEGKYKGFSQCFKLFL